MKLEKVYDLNEDYLMVPCHSPDTDAVTIRAIETETIQTVSAKFYIVNKSDNSIKSVFGLSTLDANNLKQDINTVIETEIGKANDYLSAFGILLNIVLEILLPHESTSIVEVPTLSSYTDLFERETIDYLTNAGALVTEEINRKKYINAAVIKLKSTTLWNALDVITILAQSNLWDSLKRNTNLKAASPLNWRNNWLGPAGSNLDTGMRIDGSGGTFISLGYQPFADDFNNYFPNPQFSKDSASFTVKISNAGINSGCIFRRSDSQDLLSYDSDIEMMRVNITGTNNFDDVYSFPFTGNINGIWTINRLNSTTINVWKDGTFLMSASVPSQLFNFIDCYSSLGFGSKYDNGLEATYQFACIGRGLTNDEIDALHEFLNDYLTGLPTNNVAVFA